jgi:hypothetical protein
MNKQKPFDNIVVNQIAVNLAALRAGAADNLKDPAQTLTVKREYGLHAFLNQFLCSRVRQRFDPLEQFLNTFALFVDVVLEVSSGPLFGLAIGRHGRFV